MKKLLATLMMFCACVLPANALESSINMEKYGTPIEVVVDNMDKSDWGNDIIGDKVAVLIDGTTYIHICDMAQMLSLGCSYSSGELKFGNHDELLMTTGSKVATFNGERAENLPAVPIDVKYEALVPLRYIAEAFGANVHYEDGIVYMKTAKEIYNGKEIAKVKYRSFDYYGEDIFVQESRYPSSVVPIMDALDLSQESPLSVEETPAKEYDLICCYRGIDASDNELFKYEFYTLSPKYNDGLKIETKIFDVHNDIWYNGANFERMFYCGIGYWNMIGNNDLTEE